MLMHRLICKRLQSSVQTELVKRTSRSEMSSRGAPCSLNTASKKRNATSADVHSFCSTDMNQLSQPADEDQGSSLTRSRLWQRSDEVKADRLPRLASSRQWHEGHSADSVGRLRKSAHRIPRQNLCLATSTTSSLRRHLGIF